MFHKALADINRLRIVRRLADAPATVTELIDTVGLSQPLVSHHLRRLREAGLVVMERHGRETICSLRPEAFDEVVARERVILGYGAAVAAAAAHPTATTARPVTGATDPNLTTPPVRPAVEAAR